MVFKTWFYKSGSVLQYSILGAVLFFSLKYFIQINTIVFWRAGTEGTLGHCEHIGVGRQQVALQRRNGRHRQVK
jgi:hypothetical protein